MKYLKQFAIIFGIAFIGEALHAVIPLPVPASIYGMVLLFLGLESGIIKLSSVKEVGKFLIDLMQLMFIPAAVGLLDSRSVLSGHVAEYAAIILATTFLVMAVSGLVTQAVIRRSGKEEPHE